MSDDNDSKAELIFEEPPPAKGGRGRGGALAAWLQLLRDHPGEWVKYPTDVSNGLVSHIRSGRVAGVSPGEFDVVGRMTDGRKRQHLYARYIGEGSDS